MAADAVPAQTDHTDDVGSPDDAARAAGLRADQPVAVHLDRPDRGNDPRLRLYLLDRPATLSAIVPLAERLGLVVVDEQSRQLQQPDGRVVWLHDVGVRHASPSSLASATVRAEVESTFRALWSGELEADGFNRLVIGAGLPARQVDVLRSYARYLRQVGTPYSQATIEDTVAKHAHVAKQLVGLFIARFDPSADAEQSREERTAAIAGEIVAALDAVASLDEDRILRTYLALVQATVRTSWFRPADGRAGAGAVAFKFDPSRVPDLPLPRPMHEIWVCSPSVEGVHLRGGAIARGGLRWSDRREDFRTEVLGLMKAQMVKNAVIVPVGAKGGFVVKRPVMGDADAQRAEVVACYRTFIGALLDLTDNVVGGTVVAPPDVVRHDGDDPYLVVAADKGTATFSDIANDVAASYGFWLGDAFASGGAKGYDHKAMAITARGAWESVRRHFRTLGRDADAEQLTVVGIGDMSGDVFGNGLLMSHNVRLLAAFDHRHVFLDPDPDPAASYVERRRLFELPRSSWADYDPAVISAGGGVHARSAKSIALTPAVQMMLGTSAASLTPTELISTILRARVDLLWNGGIGTYVKSAGERNAEVGDRANDGLRIDGGELRCTVVGEGGNLGFTQRGRIDAALAGVLINTDAIDNSAGVDCSDHEVNIKILLDSAVASGELTVDARDALLRSMTDEVAELVLADNRAQTLELALAGARAAQMLDVDARYLQALDLEGLVNRELEHLPTDKQLIERQVAGTGLTGPEFAVLLAYTKTTNIAELLRTDLVDDPYLQPFAQQYFPTPLRERFASGIATHRLRREIIATAAINEMVNHAGVTFDHRLTEETGASVADATRAYLASRDIVDLGRWWASIDALAATVPADTSLSLFLELRQLAERISLWLMRRRRPPIDLAATVSAFGPGFRALADRFADLTAGSTARDVRAAANRLVEVGVPTELARHGAAWPLLHTAPDIIEVAAARGRSLEDTAAAYWLVFERLDVEWLWTRIGDLSRQGRWQRQARSALVDDLLGALRSLTDVVLRAGDRFDAPNVLLISWADTDGRVIERVGRVLADIRAGGVFDVTTLTAAVRQLRGLALASGTGT